MVGVTLFVTDSATTATIPPISAVSTPVKPAMRDMSVGTDEEPFDPDAALSEEKLEKILKESGLEMGREKSRKKDKSKDAGHQVDRI